MVASIATALLVAVKLAAHWKWIAHTARRLVPRTTAEPARAAVRPQAQALSRREFVRVTGIVSVATALAIYQAANGLREAAAATAVATATTTSSGTTGSGTTGSGTTGSGTTAACSVRCNRGCAYPGHCKRYVDTTDNGRCDMGECV